MPASLAPFKTAWHASELPHQGNQPETGIPARGRSRRGLRSTLRPNGRHRHCVIGFDWKRAANRAARAFVMAQLGRLPSPFKMGKLMWMVSPIRRVPILRCNGLRFRVQCRAGAPKASGHRTAGDRRPPAPLPAEPLLLPVSAAGPEGAGAGPQSRRPRRARPVGGAFLRHRDRRRGQISHVVLSRSVSAPGLPNWDWGPPPTPRARMAFVGSSRR